MRPSKFIKIFETQQYVKRKAYTFDYFEYRSVVKIDLYASDKRNLVSIDRMEIIPCKRGKGYGSKFLELITKLADEHSIVLTLEAVPLSLENYQENTERLRRLYEKFGFEIKPNPNLKAPKTRNYMERKPSTKKE